MVIQTAVAQQTAQRLDILVESRLESASDQPWQCIQFGKYTIDSSQEHATALLSLIDYQSNQLESLMRKLRLRALDLSWNTQVNILTALTDKVKQIRDKTQTRCRAIG